LFIVGIIRTFSKVLCPHQESNLELALRRGLLYPFNYEGDKDILPFFEMILKHKNPSKRPPGVDVRFTRRFYGEIQLRINSGVISNLL
jgi:hypothetical protein